MHFRYLVSKIEKKNTSNYVQLYIPTINIYSREPYVHSQKLPWMEPKNGGLLQRIFFLFMSTSGFESNFQE